MQNGKLLRQGNPAEVLDYYNALITARERGAGISQSVDASGVTQTRSGSGEAQILHVEMLDHLGARAEKFATGREAHIMVVAATRTRLESLVAGIMIRDRSGNPVFGTNSWHLRQPALKLPGDTEVRFHFRLPLNLGTGFFSLSVALVEGENHLNRNYDWRDNMLLFEVINADQPAFVGSAFLPTQVEVSRSYPAWDLNQYGKSVYSQFGEDGILEQIFALIGAQNRCCVEFGGYDGITMSNTARLIREQGWSGGFIEADPTLYRQLIDNYREFPLVRAIQAYVEPQTIESLLAQLEVPDDFDLLCIDIDGNDYWVWQQINRYRPRAVVVECNSAYPPPQKWVMSYAQGHTWQGDDYYGASPQSLTDLARTKGYALVCCEEQGANLFFVREDYLSLFGIPDNGITTLFRPPRYGLPENRWSHPHRDGPFEAI
jgi:hypothetical protein